MRLSATKALLERKDAIIVTTVSCIYGLGSPGEVYVVAGVLQARQATQQFALVKFVAAVSCIYGLGSPETYLKMVLHVDRGDKLDQRELLRRLTSLQYTRNDMDFARATFRVRGDVIDIYPAESDISTSRLVATVTAIVNF